MNERKYFCAHNKQGSSRFVSVTGRVAVFRVGFCVCDDADVAKELEAMVAMPNSPYYIPDAAEVDALNKATEYGISPQNGAIIAEIEKQILAKHGLLKEVDSGAEAKQFNQGIVSATSALKAHDSVTAHNTLVGKLDAAVSQIKQEADKA